ncbi:MAG: hypothetical protein ACYTEQ_28005 [Planctomycetota bacterium]|jgi:hypothetical protein
MSDENKETDFDTLMHDRALAEPEPAAQKPGKKQGKRQRTKRTRRTKEQMQAARDLAEAKKILAEAKKLEAKKVLDESEKRFETEVEKIYAPREKPKTKTGDFSMDLVPEEGPSAAELKEAARLKKENQSYQRIRDEINIRRYVKKGGGWRKGVSPAQRNATVLLLQKLGRDEPVWDRTIIAKDRYDGPMQTEAQIQERKDYEAMELVGGKSGR